MTTLEIARTAIKELGIDAERVPCISIQTEPFRTWSGAVEGPLAERMAELALLKYAQLMLPSGRILKWFNGEWGEGGKW